MRLKKENSQIVITLNEFKSSGPNGMHPIVLAEDLSESLCIIFILIMEDEWSARVKCQKSPYLQKGGTGNYRLVMA